MMSFSFPLTPRASRRELSDLGGFLCNIGGSLPDNMKCLEATVVIWCDIKKTELK